MTFDGCIERGGICLFLEHKRPGVSVSTGQRFMFDALVKQGNTVIVFWGNGKQVTQIAVSGPEGRLQIYPASLEYLRKIVSDWWIVADRKYREKGLQNRAEVGKK